MNTDTMTEPTEADLLDAAADEAAALSEDFDWESLLEPVVTVKAVDEDFWAEDENVHDDRYDGDGIPSWSAWA